MERKKKKKNGGAYLAVCCCALVVAIVGYANRMSLNESEEEASDKIAEVTPSQDVMETSQKAEVEESEEKTKVEEEEVPTTKEEPKVIEFQAPVKGNVIEEYSGDDLVYNETLKDWRAHSGVDFSAALGEKVTASADGVIEKVFDSNMGKCVIIDHMNGFKTMYANLEENTQVTEGDEIKVGDVVGTVGNTALGDITDLEHVHFEMMKDGININPAEYLN